MHFVIYFKNKIAVLNKTFIFAPLILKNKQIMKKQVLTIAFAVLTAFTVSAQDGEGFAKGDVFVSGALSVSSQKTGDFKTNTFEIAPKLGYFVTENVAIGGQIDYTSTKISENPDDATNNGLGAGLFGRYYFTPASKFSFIAELGAMYTSYDLEYNIDALGNYSFNNIKSKEFGIGLGAGINYFISSNFSIETGVGVLGYTSNDNGGNGAEKTNTFVFGGDWRAVSFGVNYKF